MSLTKISEECDPNGLHTVTPKPKHVAWYRSPIDPKLLKAMHQRSDARGYVQTLGYLGILCVTGGLALYSSFTWSPLITLALLFIHGTCFGFMPNAVHELSHGTVFKTRSLNNHFLRLCAFLSWLPHEKFQISHARHHRHTLHAPEDLEVVLPQQALIKHFLQQGFINFGYLIAVLRETSRLARGGITDGWETTLLPKESAERARTIRWSRILLFGHGLIVVVSLSLGLWMIPVLTTLAPFYGGWLFFLCNSTQHIGLQDDVSDFRLCCRTFTVNPIVQFLYWHMNFHIEHHMFAAVPCYRLAELHEAIKKDLPACPHGIIATWREIAAIQEKQKVDPTYQYVVPLPVRAEQMAS